MSLGLRRTLTVVASTTLALTLAEVTLHVREPAWLRAAMSETESQDAGPPLGTGDWRVEIADNLFVAYRPDTTLPMDNPEYHVIGHGDRWGGRATSVPASAPSEVIPVLGDSQTFGLGVGDEETFVSVLSRSLGRRLLNLGLSGSGLDEQLHILVHRHEVLGAPGVWIFGFYTGNDLSDVVDDNDLDASLAQRRGSVERVERAVNAFVFHKTVLRYSHVLHLIKFGIIGAFAEAHMELRDEAFVAFDRRREEFRARAAKALGRRLDRIVELSRRLQFRPIFLIVPDAHQISPARLERGRRAYWLNPDDLDVRYPNRLLRELLDARHIPLVDPIDCMANRDDLYYREGHLNARGHAALAACAAVPLDAAIRSDR